MSRAKKSINFEKTLDQLEELVEDMEQGDLSLEEALKNFEKGIKLTRDCQTALDQAEQKVQLLIDDNQSLSGTEFDEDDLAE